MKKYVSMLAIALFSVTMVFCSSNSKNSEGETKAMAQTEKQTTVKPRYEITVTHGGRPLGKIIIETFPDVAPKMCRNFDSLVTSGFYDGCTFHRVIPNFMIQGGDPNSKNKPKETWGMGDPSQTNVQAEFSDKSHKRGILSTARRGDDVNSGTSQFFIMVKDSPFLDRQYTVFGQVLEGMDIVDKIVAVPRDARDNPDEKVEMKIKKIDN